MRQNSQNNWSRFFSRKKWHLPPMLTFRSFEVIVTKPAPCRKLVKQNQTSQQQWKKFAPKFLIRSACKSDHKPVVLDYDCKSCSLRWSDKISFIWAPKIEICTKLTESLIFQKVFGRFYFLGFAQKIRVIGSMVLRVFGPQGSEIIEKTLHWSQNGLRLRYCSILWVGFRHQV